MRVCWARNQNTINSRNKVQYTSLSRRQFTTYLHLRCHAKPPRKYIDSFYRSPRASMRSVDMSLCGSAPIHIRRAHLHMYLYSSLRLNKPSQTKHTVAVTEPRRNTISCGTFAGAESRKRLNISCNSGRVNLGIPFEVNVNVLTKRLTIW